MPSVAQKRTVLVITVIVACTFVVIYHTDHTHSSSFTELFNKAVHIKPYKSNVTTENSLLFQAKKRSNSVPDQNTLEKMSLEDISDLYFRTVNTIQKFCPVKKVYGGIRDGWYTCDVVRDKSKPCVAYLITVAENEVSKAFFRELETDYKCKTDAIIISTASRTHSSTQFRNLQEKESVDFLAVDISDTETIIMDWLLTKDLLKNVQQLLVTFHGIVSDSPAAVYVEHLKILGDLFQQGFRIFHFKRHDSCIFTGNFRRTGCYSLYMMRDLPVAEPIIIPTEEAIDSMELERLKQLYYKYIVSTQELCKQVIRVGDVDDGGWDVCTDSKYSPSSPCLVYSFGIANDWTFDDEVSKIYGCEVHSFDPSIGKQDHKRSDKITFHNLGLWGKPKGKQGAWNMSNLESIINDLGHAGKIIDVLKMDIERAEWSALPDMLATGVLNNVRQLDIEFHIGSGATSNMKFYMKILRGLYDQGFRMFWAHPNQKGGNPYTLPSTGRLVSACNENYYLNINLIK